MKLIELKDDIAGCIPDYGQSIDSDFAAKSSQAIIDLITARLHECVKPLKWVEDDWWRHYAKPSPEYLPRVAFWIMHSNEKWRFASTGEYYLTLEAAKAAAQARYAAQIIAGLDL